MGKGISTYDRPDARAVILDAIRRTGQMKPGIMILGMQYNSFIKYRNKLKQQGDLSLEEAIKEAFEDFKSGPDGNKNIVNDAFVKNPENSGNLIRFLEESLENGYVTELKTTTIKKPKRGEDGQIEYDADGNTVLELDKEIVEGVITKNG